VGDSRKAARPDWFDHTVARLRNLRGLSQADFYWAYEFLETLNTNSDASRQKEEFLGAACSTYLLAGSKQRDSIRQLFTRESWWPLLEYADEQSVGIISRSDIEPLRLGLAACSIAGLRIDYRDFLMGLGELYRRARDAGIDPLPYFKEVADLSDDEMEVSGFSTARLIAAFHETAYCKELTAKHQWPT
jgi:hypothetical protein